MDLKTTASVVGGPLAYLIGAVLFKHTLRGWFQPSHLVGIGSFVVLAIFAMRFSPLTLAGAAALLLVVVASWETLSLRSKT